MAAPVWQLSINLETKTAAFTTGLADAARGARGSFNDIRSGAAEMGSATSYSMTEARHGVMLLGEEFGVHIPRGVTAFLASLGPVGAAMQAAFPFLAIAVGATFLIEKLTKIGDEAAKSGHAWAEIADATTKWAEASKKELLDVQIQLDKLTGDKLKELQDTLKKIDLTTLDHLKSEFDGVGKKVDEEFTKMRSSWLMTQLGMGNGVADVQQMFAAAMEKINEDLAKGDQKKLASDLKAASDQMWNLAAPTYDLVQRLHEAHNEWGANKIAADGHYQALLKTHGVLASMTEELVQQQTLEKDKDGIATQTITPVHNATDPRIASELKKQLASYMETNAHKAEAAEKLSEERMKLESDVTHYFAEEAKKQAALQAEAGKEAAGHTLKMSELQIAADREAGKMRMEQLRMSAQEALDMELGFAAQEYDAKRDALSSEMAALDQTSREYENKKKALNDRLLELDKQFQNQTQSLEDQSQKKQLAAVQSWENRTQQVFAQGFASTIMRKQSFGTMMGQLESQIAESAIKTAIMSLMRLETVQGRKRFGDARTAASDAFASAGNPILGAIEATAAFAAVMAFEKGGIVPGVGRGDTVPAMLSPGEGVLNLKQMDALSYRSKFGSEGGGEVHHHHHSHNFHINAVDGASVKNMLDRHSDTFERHFHSTLRKMNK